MTHGRLRARMPSTAQAAAVAAVLFVLYSAMVLSHWPNNGFVEGLTGVAFPAMSLIYVALATAAARSARGRLRAAWLTMAAAFAAWSCGELIWAYHEHVNHRVPFPSWADAAYLAYIPLVALALLLVPSPRSWRDQSRLILDGLIVTGSFFLISWLTVMRALWEAGDGSRPEFALSLAYPAGDVLIMTLAFLVFVRAPAGLRLTMLLFVTGFAFSALGNGVWAYLGDPTRYKVGGPADIFYAANALLMIVALIAARHARPDAVTANPPRGWLWLWLPLLPVAVAAVFLTAAGQDAVLEAPVIITGALLIVATLIRQLIQAAELVRREQQVRVLADRLTDELDSAADYVASILPGDLTGPVEVRSRYLPSQGVGGDSFGYTWIDDDHLIVYLIDVSGHGVRPALLSVSVHNLLRSGALSAETLHEPDLVLAELNTRFSMDNHASHYFTMWYGVYRQSTGVLRYAGAGHPPPLLLTAQAGTLTCTPLEGTSMPVGMFSDTEFSVHSHVIPADARILLYSDGALGDPPEMDEFVTGCTELAGREDDWLDPLIERIPVGPDGGREDDCSLVLLAFPGAADMRKAPETKVSRALRSESVAS